MLQKCIALHCKCAREAEHVNGQSDIYTVGFTSLSFFILFLFLHQLLLQLRLCLLQQ